MSQQTVSGGAGRNGASCVFEWLFSGKGERISLENVNFGGFETLRRRSPQIPDANLILTNVPPNFTGQRRRAKLLDF